MFASLLLLSAYYQLTTVYGDQHLRSLSSPTACRSCEAVIVLPPRCTFECQDAVLSGQGTTVVKGHFSKNDFIVESAFDTWRAHELSQNLLRVTSTDAQCEGAVCEGTFAVKNLQTGSVFKVKALSFAAADDTNYRLEAQRALSSLTSVDGLLLTGTSKKSKLNVRYVFRPWISEAVCDPAEKAKTLAVPAGATDYVFKFMADDSEARQGADGLTLYWAMPVEEDVSSATWRLGSNDLWSQVVKIDKVTCASLETTDH